MKHKPSYQIEDRGYGKTWFIRFDYKKDVPGSGQPTLYVRNKGGMKLAEKVAKVWQKSLADHGHVTNEARNRVKSYLASDRELRETIRFS